MWRVRGGSHGFESLAGDHGVDQCGSAAHECGVEVDLGRYNQAWSSGENKLKAAYGAHQDSVS